MERESFYILEYKPYVYYLCQWLEETVPAQVVEGHTTMCSNALSKKNHHCQLQLVTTTTCAQGATKVSATTTERCKDLEYLDQHQCMPEQEEANTCNYNHHHH